MKPSITSREYIESYRRPRDGFPHADPGCHRGAGALARKREAEAPSFSDDPSSSCMVVIHRQNRSLPPFSKPFSSCCTSSTTTTGDARAGLLPEHYPWCQPSFRYPQRRQASCVATAGERKIGKGGGKEKKNSIPHPRPKGDGGVEKGGNALWVDLRSFPGDSSKQGAATTATVAVGRDGSGGGGARVHILAPKEENEMREEKKNTNIPDGNTRAASLCSSSCSSFTTDVSPVEMNVYAHQPETRGGQWRRGQVRPGRPAQQSRRNKFGMTQGEKKAALDFASSRSPEVMCKDWKEEEQQQQGEEEGESGREGRKRSAAEGFSLAFLPRVPTRMLSPLRAILLPSHSNITESITPDGGRERNVENREQEQQQEEGIAGREEHCRGPPRPSNLEINGVAHEHAAVTPHPTCTTTTTRATALYLSPPSSTEDVSPNARHSIFCTSIGLNIMRSKQVEEEKMKKRKALEGKGYPLVWPNMPVRPYDDRYLHRLTKIDVGGGYAGGHHGASFFPSSSSSMHHRRWYFLSSSLSNPFRAPRLADTWGGRDFHFRRWYHPALAFTASLLPCGKEDDAKQIRGGDTEDLRMMRRKKGCGGGEENGSLLLPFLPTMSMPLKSCEKWREEREKAFKDGVQINNGRGHSSSSALHVLTALVPKNNATPIVKKLHEKLEKLSMEERDEEKRKRKYIPPKRLQEHHHHKEKGEQGCEVKRRPSSSPLLEVEKRDKNVQTTFFLQMDQFPHLQSAVVRLNTLEGKMDAVPHHDHQNINQDKEEEMMRKLHVLPQSEGKTLSLSSSLEPSFTAYLQERNSYPSFKDLPFISSRTVQLHRLREQSKKEV